MVYYITTLLVYGGVDAIACLGLSQQFGVAGVTNFGFIIFQAAGAYTAGVLSLPPDSANGGFQSYVGGLDLPFPLPWIGAAIVGGLLAVPFTSIVGKRLRGDFAAVGLLVTAVMFNLLVTNYVPFLNGAAGLSLVPSPLRATSTRVGRLPVGLGGRGRSARAARLPVRPADHEVALRAHAARDARQRRRRRLPRQEPAFAADVIAGRRRRDRRALGRRARRLHQPLGPAGLGLRRDRSCCSRR